MKHRFIKAAAIMTTLVLTFASSSLAGTWTHKDSAGYSWDYLWFYVKDNGAYAKSEWVDDQGTWYWINDMGIIPTGSGIASDGCLYNSQGIYVPTNDGAHHFIDQNMYSQIQKGMSADQVNAILGQPHESSTSYASDFGSQHFEYSSYIWYSSDGFGRIYVYYTNGVVSFTSAYWH